MWGILAGLVLTASAEPDAILVKRATGAVELRWQDQVVPCPGAEQAQVSPSGNRVAVWNSRGPLLVARKSGVVEKVADQTKWASWNPLVDEILVLQTDGKLFTKNLTTPSEAAETLANDAVAAAWSPDGQRVALATKGNVYVRVRSTGELRRALTDRSPVALAWSPDGRRLAVAEPGLGKSTGKVAVYQLRDGAAASFASANATRIAWSPDSRRLALSGAGDVSVWDVSTKQVTRVVGARATPQWTAATELIALVPTGLAQWKSGQEPQAAPLPGLDKGDQALAWSRRPGTKITNDILVSSPFAKASRPGHGQLRLNGVIDHADPLEGRFSLLTTETTDTAGRVTVFPRPTRVDLTVSPSANQTDGVSTRPVRLIDLRNESEVSVVVDQPMLAGTKPLNAVNVWVAETSLELVAPIGSAPRLPADAIVEYDRTTRTRVVVPMVFPVAGKCGYEDDFQAPRKGHRHQGHDLMCAKLTPLVACFDGVVYLGMGRGTAGNTLRVAGDNGWEGRYYHVNNDTPGTNDGASPEEWVFAPGLRSGQRVYAGQFLGYSGNSGNAESTAPHCHFELWDSVTGTCVNPHASLVAATKLKDPQSKVVPAKVDLKKGESRWDGVVRVVDAATKSLELEVWSKSDGTKTTTMTKPTKVKVKWGDGTSGVVLGNENIEVAFAEVRAGLQAVVVGKPQSTGLVPRVALFAPPS